MVKANAPIIIRSFGVVSALGSQRSDVFNGFNGVEHHFVRREFAGQLEWVAPIDSNQEQRIADLRSERNLYRELDRAVLMAILAARDAYGASGWDTSKELGVVVGSSRGATETFERSFSIFSNNPSKRLESVTSPTTTLGNISTSIAQDLLLQGPALSHSVTCSTALHSILNATAWMNSGMCDRFIAGGSEAALTEFTIAQMKAMRIYTSNIECEYPCRPLETEHKENSFALGEGAVMFALESANAQRAPHIARIDGMGWGMEAIESLSALSADGRAFYDAMKAALESQQEDQPVDIIVAHAPGTLVGDRAEVAAIHDLFGERPPVIVSPKWKIGHAFGASGAFSMLYAIHLLNGGRLTVPPFIHAPLPIKIASVMINAAGFGGNACSLILKR